MCFGSRAEITKEGLRFERALLDEHFDKIDRENLEIVCINHLMLFLVQTSTLAFEGFSPSLQRGKVLDS